MRIDTGVNHLRVLIGAIPRSIKLKKKIPNFDAILDPNASAHTAKIAALQAERIQLDEVDKVARTTLAAAQAAADKANSDHVRLFQICAGTAAEAPGVEAPLDRLGAAVLAVSTAGARLRSSVAEADQASTKRVERQAQIEGEIGTIKQAISKGRMHALIGEYERRIQTAELGHLSDEIRKAAAAVSIRPEPDSALMTEGRVTVCGYPLRPWG